MKNKLSIEQQQFILRNAKGKTTKELTNLINYEFKTNLLVNQIRNFKKKNKIRSGVDTRFKKLKEPHNHKQIGSEFISKDYVFVKIAEPNKWQLKHRYIYQSLHGDIPKGHSVIFADGNKRNFDIENLILVETKDKLTAKNKHLIFNDKELTKTGLLIAKLINKTSEINK